MYLVRWCVDGGFEQGYVDIGVVGGWGIYPLFTGAGTTPPTGMHSCSTVQVHARNTAPATNRCSFTQYMLS